MRRTALVRGPAIEATNNHSARRQFRKKRGWQKDNVFCQPLLDLASAQQSQVTGRLGASTEGHIRRLSFCPSDVSRSRQFGTLFPLPRPVNWSMGQYPGP
jgi:hypothetical protein